MVKVRDNYWFLSVLCSGGYFSLRVLGCLPVQSLLDAKFTGCKVYWMLRSGPQLLVNHYIFWLVELHWFNLNLNLTPGFWMAAHSTVITRLGGKSPLLWSGRLRGQDSPSSERWLVAGGISTSCVSRSEVCVWINGQTTLHSFSLLMQSFAWETQVSASKWEFHIEMLGKFYLLQLHLVCLFYNWECWKDEVWVFEQAMAGKAWLYQLHYSKHGVNYCFSALNYFQFTPGLAYAWQLL